MSYSRWIGSRWYTFACGDAKKIWDEQFCIDCEWYLSYRQLYFFKWYYLMKIWLLASRHYNKKPTWNEMIELKEYMNRFLRDMKKGYKEGRYPC